MLYSTQYISPIDLTVSTSTHLFTNTTDEWKFVYYPSTSNSIVYSSYNDGRIGNTKAHILLIQETN